MNTKIRLLAVSALAAVAALVLLAEPAFAAADAQGAGESIGDVVRDLAKPLVITIAGAMGIAALVKRDVGMALTLLVLVLILSGFLIEDSPIEDLATGIWQQIGGEAPAQNTDPVPGPGT